MNKLILSFLLLAPAMGVAAVGSGDLPAGTIWYLHADLAGMRDAESGRELYRWLDGEVFIEINDEVGIDVGKEIDRVTAFSSREGGVTIVVEGPVSQATRDKLMALVALEKGYDLRSHGGRDYFFSGDPDHERDAADPMGDLDDAAFFSFALPGRLLVTSQEDEMRALLDRKGRIAGGGSHNGALLVLSADSTFVQAGMRTDQVVDPGDDDWDSNILRNTEQAALLVAARGGLLAVEAQLKSRDPKLAQSLHSVVNGLISLQAFNDDIDPELREMLNNTRVTVEDAVLSLSTVLDPARVVQVLSD